MADESDGNLASLGSSAAKFSMSLLKFRNYCHIMLQIFTKKLIIFTVIFLLTLQVLLRFVNLEQKPFWGDEADSLSWISGIADFKSIAFQGREMSVGEVLSYQKPHPSSNLIDTYNIVHPQHPPLYYLLARLWMQADFFHFTTARSLAALISLLVFPSIYWLCLELFHSSLVGWMAIAIVAVSPFHFLYAQEARQYTLWIVLILLTSLTLLRSMRLQTSLSWLSYIVTLTLMLYTHLLSLTVVFIYSIYAVMQEGFRLTKTLRAYLLSSFISFLLFMPWLIVIANNSGFDSDQSPGWSKKPTFLIVLIKTWIVNLNRVFWDFNQNFEYQNSLFYLLTLGLIIYVIYFLWHHTEKRAWLLLVLSIVIPFLLLATPDLLLGGRRSTPIRYFIPSYLAIEIAIAYLLYHQLFVALKIPDWQRKCWQLITSIVILVGIFSSGLIVSTDTWWNKHSEYYHSAMAKIVNQSKRPLVIAPWFDIRTLAHSFSNRVTFQEIRLLPDISSVGEGFSEVFLYQDRLTLERLLESQPRIKIKEVYHWQRQTTPVNTTKKTLWQLGRD